jgi:hypothetical protein
VPTPAVATSSTLINGAARPIFDLEISTNRDWRGSETGTVAPPVRRRRYCRLTLVKRASLGKRGECSARIVSDEGCGRRGGMPVSGGNYRVNITPNGSPELPRYESR